MRILYALCDDKLNSLSTYIGFLHRSSSFHVYLIFAGEYVYKRSCAVVFVMRTGMYNNITNLVLYKVV